MPAGIRQQLAGFRALVHQLEERGNDLAAQVAAAVKKDYARLLS